MSEKEILQKLSELAKEANDFGMKALASCLYSALGAATAGEPFVVNLMNLCDCHNQAFIQFLDDLKREEGETFKAN